MVNTVNSANVNIANQSSMNACSSSSTKLMTSAINDKNTNLNPKLNINTENEKEHEDKEETWKTVNYRKNYATRSQNLRNKICTGKPQNGDAMAKLKVVTRLSWIYLSGFSPETTAQEIISCLNKDYEDKYVCELITKRPNPRVVSFKLGVPTQLEKQMTALDSWPEGIIVDKYTPRRKEINTNFQNGKEELTRS